MRRPVLLATAALAVLTCAYTWPLVAHTRIVRLRQTGRDQHYGWTLVEFRVIG
jgi:hypothetical protein